ncbi:ABC transporter permease [Thiospirochaeta perfilievii]|uniref:ABC transporter permease n=1 Tax=Thiospirochaeta perfilievii TaxID=252967 RepID=A0A5C1Q8H8_9SPIO|nr:ABC transporter permease [Thiospirochaeta perfilievii]QEN03668.1 ABC transporter permease [Thiospirochaeta perfilievii]
MNKKSILLGISTIFVIWFLFSIIINKPIIPLPSVVIKQLFIEFSKGTIFLHLLASILRIISSLFISLTIGIPVGIITAKIKKLDSIFSPILYLLYPIPKIAFLPIIMVLFGLGNTPKIILISSILFFPITIAVRDRTKQLPKEYDYLAKVFLLTKKQILFEITLPGILPSILSAIRISIGISLSVLFFSENFATVFGIGYYIMNSWVMVDYPQMYVGIIMLSFTGLGLYLSLDIIEKKIVPWHIHLN